MVAFPQVPRDLDIEVLLGGPWVNITNPNYVQNREPVTIGRGRADESSQVDPSRLTMTLNNRDGRWSPRNPLGVYYGLLGRNVQVRASVKRGGLFLDLPGADGDEVTAPDSASLSVTGDIDIRIDLTTSYWTERNLCGKYKTTGNQRSWSFQIDPDGYLVYAWSTAGTSASGFIANSTLPIPLAPGRRAVRVTHDVNNGASGNTVTFYTSDTINGAWTQLGTPVITSGITSIFDSTAPIEIGDIADLFAINGAPGSTGHAVAGYTTAFQLRNGIAGTIVANPDFTIQTAGAPSFADTASPANTWTLAGGTSITNRRWRFHGEMSTLPARWDTSGNDVYVPAEANGLMRRLGQGSKPVRSPIFRGILTEGGVVAYWPGEDGSDAKAIASGLPTGQPMVPSSPPSFAGSDVFEASESLPTVSNTSWAGPVPVYTPTTTAQVRFLLAIPSSGTTNNAIIMRILTTGTAARWEIFYTTTGGDGEIGVRAFDVEGNSIFSNSSYGPFNGFPYRVSFELTQSGSDINYAVNFVAPGDLTASGFPGTVTGRTFSRIKTIMVDPTNNIDDTTVGHISVHTQITSIFSLNRQMEGWIGETAGRRVERLCAEEGITFRGIGSLDDSAPLGIQKAGTLLGLFQEAADADLGILFEPREILGIGYRTRTSMYNQDPRVAINYAASELTDSLDPVDDDQAIRNSVTVSRTGGGSARVDITDGPMSTKDPPNGVGLYADQPSISLQDDQQCAYQASWRAHIGTVDEARYPQIDVHFSSLELQANPALVQQLLEHEVGDRLTVSSPPPWLPPDPISQLSQGYTETFTNFLHDMTMNCAPASPYEIAVWGTDRYDTAGSQLASSISASGTTTATHVSSTPAIQNSSATAVAVTMPAVAAGNTLLIGVCWESSAGSVPTITSVVDSRGNTYTTTPDISSNAGTTLAVATIRGRITTPLQAGDTITITLAVARTRWAIQVDEFTGPPVSPLDKIASNSPGSGTSMSTGTTATTSEDNEIAYAVWGLGTGRTLSLPGGWTGGAQVATTAGTTDRALQTAWSFPTSAGPQNATLTVTAGGASTYAAAISTYKVASAATISVATTLGPLWTTAAGDMPFDIMCGGEQMTVTAISGASSPQSLTVARGVNGIAVAHAAGTDVRLANPTYREL